jgi:DNA repair protein RadC
VANLPAHERPRERLLRLGVGALSDCELLALVLRSGRRGEGAIELASSLLAWHGSLHALALARPEELAATSGVGPAKAAAVVAALQLAGRADSRPVPTVLRDRATGNPGWYSRT